MSRLCEAFGMTPTKALKELRRAPDLVARVLEEREYASLLARWESAADDKDVPKDGENELFDLVIANETDRLRERARRQ